MRKITEQAANAFECCNDFKQSNTEVYYSPAECKSYLYLFGHTIATSQHGVLQISACGYLTVTTKERLNGLTGVSIQQKKGVWFLNGVEWDGELITVK